MREGKYERMLREGKYERMLESARLLMAKTEDPAASESEAAADWERAQKIMNEYAIKDWQPDQQGRMNDPIIEENVLLLPENNPMNRNKCALAMIVARGNRATAFENVYKKCNGREMVVSVTFCGTERDCRHSRMIWTSMETYRASHWRSAARQDGAKPNAKWRNIYYQDFEERVFYLYEKLRLDREENTPTNEEENELVAVRSAQIKKFLEGLEDVKKVSHEDLPLPDGAVDAKAVKEGRRADNNVALGLDERHRRNQIESKEA